MPNDRIADMIERVGRIEANAIMSPADEAILDVCKSLINEVQVLDAELSMITLEDELDWALRRLGREGVNNVLRKALGTPNPLYVDELGNG